MHDFHFIRPLWLFAIFVLVAALYLLKHYQSKQSGWNELIPAHLAKMLIDQGNNKQPLSLFLPFVIGLLAIVALAGPTWKKLPQPVYQTEQGSVLIMDMSYSMLSTDLTPNRLTRARYKANDLLDSLNEGQMGLIAYAGDAFTISPLTEDVNNLKLLLPSLTPDIMPVYGSNPMAALTLANEMLTNAGHLDGNIYWFTDGIENSDIQDITQWSREHPHRLNILGIGTKNGAPIKLNNGELMKDNSGAIIVPKLPESALYGVAHRGDGIYQNISSQSSDIDKLLAYATGERLGENLKEDDNQLNMGDQWQEAGPWLVIAILPLLLFYFRRGTLLSLLPLCFLMPVDNAHASLWQDLWNTADQQAQKQYQQENYQQAADTFQDSNWQGSAHYKAGDYEKALEAFQKSDSAQALYNQGNSYAQLQQLDKAIEAYDKALAKNPNMVNAKANKALLEKLKEQQEQQQNSDQQNQDENQDQESEDEQEQNADENQQGSDDGEQQDQQGQPQDQQSQDEQESQNNEQSSDQESDQNADQNSEQQNAEQNEENSESETDQEQAQSAAEQQVQQSEEAKNDEQESEQAKKAAQLAKEQLDQENEQKHQQLLNKVTDDPHLLLRNKMQLEYQKRRHEQSGFGEQKKW